MVAKTYNGLGLPDTVTVGTEGSGVVVDVVAFAAERMENMLEVSYLTPTVEFTKSRK